MSSEPNARHAPHRDDAGAAGRRRFVLLMTVILGLIAAGVSYSGTWDAWVVPGRPLSTAPESTPGVAAGPVWDIELPEGPHRDAFQTSCLICHSARLPLGQPPFGREKWAEIVHKMTAVYGAPVTTEDESHVVDYLLAARPPAP